ncbi:MAG: hypothetical protein H6502_00340 [Candidatus Woesearchaeota archaeon]|nr:MAG: hypothetical protein H6502_00340 [Candidatus Woesearchaeota archaeon]
MTKPLTQIMMFFTVSAIILLVITGMFLQSSLQKTNNEIHQLLVRKEDLAARQQELSLLIQDANATLQQVKANNSLLRTELGNLLQQQQSREEAALVAQQTPPPPPPPPPDPLPAPVARRIVTRAS